MARKDNTDEGNFLEAIAAVESVALESLGASSCEQTRTRARSPVLPASVQNDFYDVQSFRPAVSTGGPASRLDLWPQRGVSFDSG